MRKDVAVHEPGQVPSGELPELHADGRPAGALGPLDPGFRGVGFGVLGSGALGFRGLGFRV